VQIPTGGNRLCLSPLTHRKMCRFGVIPKPTVSVLTQVRMEEEIRYCIFMRPVVSEAHFLYPISKGRQVMNTGKTTNKTRMYVSIGIFSAIAFVLQVIGSMMGLKVAGFLEIEFSDLPALIMSFAFGPLAGIFTEFVKNVLHCSMSSTGFVGEFANFVINGTLCAIAGIIYRYNKTRKGAVISLIWATLGMVFAGILANLFVMLPLYMPTAPFAVKLNLVLGTILPFNLARVRFYPLSHF